MTPANKAEVKELEPILEKAPIWGRLYADKGYASCANKQLLKKSKIKNGIMEKARVNKPLTAAQKRFNRLIAKIRSKVKQGFGTLKTRFKFARASYFTAAKVRGQMVLKALAFNLLKGLNKINLILRSTEQLRPV